MAVVTLPHIGDLDLEKPEACYSAQVNSNYQVVIYLWDKTIDLTRLQGVKSLLESIEKYNCLNSAYILKDFLAGIQTREYLNHHLSEIPAEILDNLVLKKENEAEPILQLLSRLTLYKVWFSVYAEKDIEIMFDYTIGIHLTPYKLVLVRDLNGELLRITMES